MKNDNSNKSNTIIEGGSFRDNTAHHVSSATKRQQNQLQTPENALRNSLVRPTIYSYTCRGSLYFDDARPNSNSQNSIHNNNHNHRRDLHLPLCMGIETNLQRVMDLPPMSKERAVQRFIHETDPYGGDDEIEEEKQRGGKLRDGEYGATEQRERLVEKYGYDPTRTRPIVAYAPNQQTQSSSSSTYSSCDCDGDLPPPPSSSIPNHNTKTASLKRHNGIRGDNMSENNDNGEEKVESEEQWSTLSCYGNTQVSVLMLQQQQAPSHSSSNNNVNGETSNNKGKDSKSSSNNISLLLQTDETELAGMSPDCTLGFTLKEVGTDDGGESLLTLQLGPLEISVQNHFDFEEEEEGVEDDYENQHDLDFASAGVSSQKQEQHHSSRQKHPVINNHPEQQQKYSSKKDNSNNYGGDNSGNNNMEPFEKRFLNKMSETASSMKSNAEILYHEANSKDFPSKVVTSGEKVIGGFGKTLQNMDKFANDLVKMWSPSSSPWSSGEDDRDT
uniref:Uncharacterized protein n=2 Tax=Helicotheca tamesis TaxID=374047 RepID=A0A7S2IEE9_9STRA|mmetsp:Transcript_8597/g.11873  ORF Transcript_8597/g.11873 Transcript_8597/m.11873 type:complete len:501 (+) Transcript_8597:75-1577(+)